MKKSNDKKLKKLLNETPEIQIAVIATKLFYIEDDLKELISANTIEHKEMRNTLNSLASWKLKVTAMAAGAGLLGGFIITILKVLF